MSETADPSEEVACARAERDGPLGCNPGEIVALLTDDDARAIYRFVDDPAPVGEIAETLDLPSRRPTGRSNSCRRPACSPN